MTTACSTPPAPVDTLRQPPSFKIKTHVVGKGETLFSIAWAYGLDYRDLARRNSLDRSYTIYPGQVLRLDIGTVAADPAPTIAKKPVESSANKKPTASPQPTPVSKPVPPPVANKKPAPVNVGAVSWRWPAPGKIISRFSDSGNVNKGIDIAGNLGEPVSAASSGRVVYAGSGLMGYGLLIIIKHNDQFLSAYAHNRVLDVKEGDEVKAGQKIAEIGTSGTDKVKLHFEIRRDGKPVDPEDYLPKR